MRATRIAMPAAAKKGEIIEIKTLISHHMETGYRRDNVGVAIARDIVTSLAVTYAGVEVFRADLFPGVAANPFFAFSTIATETGEIVFTWTDQNGEVTREARLLEVL